MIKVALINNFLIVIQKGIALSVKIIRISVQNVKNIQLIQYYLMEIV